MYMIIGLKYSDIYRLFYLFLGSWQGCFSKMSPLEIIIDRLYRELSHSILSRVIYQPEWLTENTVVCERPVSILAVHRSRARENTRSARDIVIVA